jgi:NAD(P)H-nitrite reductase large subunit
MALLVKMTSEQRANMTGAPRDDDVERTLQLIEIVPRWRTGQKKAPELPPGQDYKATL